MNSFVEWASFVAGRWRRRGAAHEAVRRRSDITYFIVHRKVHHSDGPSWSERSAPERLTHDTDPEGCQTMQINILGSPVVPTTSCTFPGQWVINGLARCYVRTYNPNNIQQLVAQLKYRSQKWKILVYPSVQCFLASIPLFMQYYNTHTIDFHIPQWLPLAVCCFHNLSLDIGTDGTSGL